MTTSALKAARFAVKTCYSDITRLLESTEERPVRRILSGHLEVLARRGLLLSEQIARAEKP